MDTTIKNAPFGFAHHEIIVSDNGEPADYRFLEMNQAFEELTGLSGESIRGKSFSELQVDTLLSHEKSEQISAPTNAPIAPEVKKIFKITFEEEIKRQTAMMVIDQIYSMADTLDNFSVEYQIPALKEKTGNLRNHLETFEIENIRNELKQIIKLFK